MEGPRWARRSGKTAETGTEEEDPGHVAVPRDRFPRSAPRIHKVSLASFSEKEFRMNEENRAQLGRGNSSQQTSGCSGPAHLPRPHLRRSALRAELPKYR